VQVTQIREQVLEGCSRLAVKGFLNTPEDSFSMRIPCRVEMILISGINDWRRIDFSDLRTVSFSDRSGRAELHAPIYQERGDVGAITISSPKGVRLLANSGSALPPVFDEQVRHIGSSGGSLESEQGERGCLLRKNFKKGSNAALRGEQLVCLGMTRDRVLFNTELYEKCAQAYVIANASNTRISRIPLWVRMIANRRLLKDERVASASYLEGRIPEGVTAY
jgi:ribulose-5-phosphate 4-epimerase/fuculose-1-phosphate aldolase